MRIESLQSANHVTVAVVRRPRRKWRWTWLLVLVPMLVAPGCGPGDSGKSPADEAEVPQPDVLPPTPVKQTDEVRLRQAFDLPAAEVPHRLIKREGKIIRVHLEHTSVESIAPLKGLALEQLTLNHTKVADLSPIAGMPLEWLNLQKTPVADISPVKGMKSLSSLWLNKTKVTDLTPLQGLMLLSLDLTGTKVADLSPLAGMSSLKRLNLEDSAVTDLTPLKGLALQRIIFDPAKIRKGLDVVRNMPSLTAMHTYFPPEVPPRFFSPREFWTRHAANALPRR